MPKIDDLQIFAKNLCVEAALRQPAMERSLAAFKTVERNPGSRRLALAAARRSFTLAGADATPNTLCPVMRAGLISDLVEFHFATILSVARHNPHSASPGMQ